MAALIAAGTALPALANAPRASSSLAGWVQPCGGTSWFAGSTDVCDGSVAYRDYVNDDEGADTGGLGYDAQGTQNAFGTIAPPAGDRRYPASDTSTSDLVSLTLTRVGDRVDVVAEVAALRHPGSTVLALAVDTDGNPRTGGGSWPGLGVRSGGWNAIYTIRTGDPSTHLLRGSFPLPRARTWRVQAVTAQAATGTVMNVAFRGVAEQAAYKLTANNPSPNAPSGQGAWFEDRQAAALKTGDISPFGYTVTTADLRRGVQRLQHVAPGLHERVYTSRYSLGQGMSYAGVPGRGDGGTAKGFFAQSFNLLGRYQPYGVYLPKAPGRLGLQMEWHGSNQGIVAQINQPGMQQRFGEDLHRALVVPEARGPNGYGSDISERDLLDVMADAQRTFGTDPARTFSSGYSQGGYLAFRMAMLYPDRFAGLTSWVGFTGDDANGTGQNDVTVTAGAVGNMLNYVGNLRHVPGSMLYSGADELVQVPSSTAMQRAFAATDDTYTWYLHPTADHFTYAIADDWAKEASISRGENLVNRPARVTFKTDPVLDAPAYGIRHDRAYWVSELRGGTSGPLQVDLTSRGCGVTSPVQATTRGVGPSPVPWTSVAQQPVGVHRLPAAQLLEGTLTNVGSAALDLRSACLRPGAAYRLTSNRPVVLHLSDGRDLHLAAGTSRGRLS